MTPATSSRRRWLAGTAVSRAAAGGGGTGNAERAGAGGSRPNLQVGGREPRASRRSALAAALLLAAYWGAPPLFAAGPQPVCPSPADFGLLKPDSLGPGDQFGSAVAIGDGVVAVGAYLSNAGGPESGAVYLFSPDKAGIWSQTGRTLVERPGDWFGFDVAIDGTTLLVGAPRAHDGSGAQTGAVYKFDLSNLKAGQVMAQDPLPIPPGHAGDEIGSAVALSGDCWAVGARSDGTAGAGAGSVYASCVKQQMPQKLLPAPPAEGAEFGQSLSLSLDGKILAVGAPFAEPAGAAYIFEFDAVHNLWQQQGMQLPTAGVPAPGAAFGYAVALSGNQVVVGAPLDRGEAGAAYLYTLAPAQGPKQLLPPDPTSGAQFGVAVAFDRMDDPSEKILVGARRANGDQGAAYLFSSDGLSSCTLSPPPLQPGDEFGFETAIRGGTLLVGAFMEKMGQGAAYIFTPPVKPVAPQLSKSIAATSQPVTGTPTPLAIGEVVRYDLQTTLPVGPTPGLTFTDALPPGLLWMPGSCVLSFQSPGVTILTGFPTFTGSSGPPTFTGPSTFSPTLTVNFSTVTTSGPRPGALAVECNALVLDSPPGPPPTNHPGNHRPNRFTATISPSIGPPVTFTSNVVPAVVVEPAGGLVQQEIPAATPTQVGYSLTYTNTGTATAYDVDIHDPLPAFLTVATGVIVSTSSPSLVCTVNSPPPTALVDVTCPQVPPGGTVTVTFAAAVLPLCVSATNQPTLTYTSLPGLHGTVPNPTGAFPPGAPGAPKGKRIYTSSASTVSLHCIDLAIQKSHDFFNLSPCIFPPCTPLGGNFTLRVTNVGNTPSVGLATVTDVLPEGLVCSHAGGDGWTCACSSSSQTVTSTRTMTILPSESSSISIAVAPAIPLIPGPYINCASVATTFDFNPNNDTSCVEVPFCIGFPDATKMIPNMIGWFPFDEKAGEESALEWVNLVSFPYVPSGPNSPQPTPGMVAEALCFNAPGSYVDVVPPPSPPSPSGCPGSPGSPGPYDLGTCDLTIDTWVKTSANSGLQPILDKRPPAHFFPHDLIGYNFFLSNGLVAFSMADSSGSTDWVAPAGTGVADGTWHHVAVTVDRSDSAGGIFYVDCVPVGTFDPTGRPGDLTNGADLWIAAEYGPNGGPAPAETLSGCLDELEIFNRALSPREIQDFCTAGAYGKCKFKTFPH